MKLIVPTAAKSPDSPVADIFGRAAFFALYDTESDSFSYLPNPAAEAQGGAGVKAAQAVVDSGAECLVTFRCGENAAEVLVAAGIKIYEAQPGTVAENAAKCKDKKLVVLHEIHAGFHHGESGK